MVDIINLWTWGDNVPFWWGNVDNVRGYACVGTGGKWEIYVSFSQLVCEPKTPVFKK